MSLVQTLGAFVVALGALIVVHELGHYAAARLCGVKVLRFSIGFGRPIARWRRGADATEWAIAAVPLGGYVKMLDEREGPVAPHEAARAFNRQSVGRRFFIVAAGPACNFAFAIALYAALYMIGVPEARPVLAEPPSGTPAATAGLRAGATVRAIDGTPIATWQALRWRVLQAALARERLQLEVAAADGTISLHVLDLRDVRADELENDALDRLGLRLYRPPVAPVFGRIVAGGAAERAGLKPGDRVLAIDGEPVTTWDELVHAVRARPGGLLVLRIARDGSELDVRVSPESANDGGARIGRIGAAPRVPAEGVERLLVEVRYGPLESLARATAKTWDIALFSLAMLWRMLIGEASWKHLSGPVTIADYAGQSAQMGWVSYLTFLALVSISLGVLNLLPIPLLDGGHLMYYAVEIIKGSPVSERAMELGQRVGLALLLVLMAFAFYNDLNRLFSG
ncbi:MAG: RIP metalloprotease RseP [Burkholderiales bacterium]|nr:RIP metalloprotease RseP [Burkholderiales bacterium]